MSGRYVSIAAWRDLEDNHLYAEGEAFPHDGREIPETRIAELSDRRNKAGFALIKALPNEDEENPKAEPETPKTTVRGRRKAK